MVIGAQIAVCDALNLDALDRIFQEVQAHIVVLIPESSSCIVLRVNNILEAAKRVFQTQSIVFWSSLGVAHALELPGDDTDIPIHSNQSKQLQMGTHRVNAMALMLEAEELIRYFGTQGSTPEEPTITTAVFRIGFDLQSFYVFKNIMQNRGMVPFPSEDDHFAPLDLIDAARATVGLFAKSNRIPDDYAFGPDKPPVNLTGTERLSGPMFVTHCNEGLGARLLFTQVQMSDMRSFLKQTNLNPFELSYQYCMWRLFDEGHLELCEGGTLRDLLGRSGSTQPPITIAEFFKKHASDFSPRVFSELPLFDVPVLDGLMYNWRTRTYAM
jgi:hypothetical protein